MIDWGLGTLRATVRAFAEELLLDADLVDPDADLRPAVTDALRLFWEQPTRAEAEAWGAFPWEDGFGAETRHVSLARGLRLSDAGTLLRSGSPGRLHRASWRAGTLVLTSRPTRLLLRTLARVGRELRRRS